VSTRIAKRLVFVVAGAALLATPAATQTLPYGGIGATVSSFEARNPHSGGTPPVGVAYYRVTGTRLARVQAFSVLVNPKSQLRAIQLVRLLLGTHLPPDTTTVQRWNGYCVILKSRWLGREIGLPYLWTWVSQPEQTAVIQASTAPACRG
jgi:hypothetical protein